MVVRRVRGIIVSRVVGVESCRDPDTTSATEAAHNTALTTDCASRFSLAFSFGLRYQNFHFIPRLAPSVIEKCEYVRLSHHSLLNFPDRAMWINLGEELGNCSV